MFAFKPSPLMMAEHFPFVLFWQIVGRELGLALCFAANVLIHGSRVKFPSSHHCSTGMGRYTEELMEAQRVERIDGGMVG